MARKLGYVDCPVCMLTHKDPEVLGGAWFCYRCGTEVPTEATETDGDDL